MKNMFLLLALSVVVPSIVSGPVQGVEQPDRRSSSERAERDRNQSFGMVDIGLGYLSGSSLYHISSYDAAGSGVESELEFPLNTLLFGLEGAYITRNARNQNLVRISIQWFTSIDSGSGKLKDSDWLTSDYDVDVPTPGAGFPHPGLDIYSESDIKSNVNIIDLRLSQNYWPAETWGIGPLAGLMYQKFEFDASNVQQTGYGPYAGTLTGAYAGAVLTYEVTYTIPFLGLHSESRFGRDVQLLLDLGYSPWARAEDEDDHLLRGKLSKGSTKGNAVLGTVTLFGSINKDDHLQLRGQYLRIRTRGTQDQEFYDGSGVRFTGIDDRIDSDQAALFFLYGSRF